MAAAPLALTLGDPCGIGPEITVKAWQKLRDSEHHFFLFGAPSPFIAACKHAHVSAPIFIESPDEAASAFKDALPILPLDDVDFETGKPSPDHASAIIGSIEKAVELSLNGKVSGVVTNPIAKSVLYDAGFTFAGHTEFIGELTSSAPHIGPRGPIMMLTAAGLRVALLTVHEPLSRVPELITAERLDEVAKVVHHALQRDFGISAPRIALCGLNPHAGEDGKIGREEPETLNPAAAKLRAQGIDISDARSADTLFHAEAREDYDAAIACYHDQGLIPVKTLDFHGGVNATLGLPIIRTSPDHGTAFNIAGQGIARPDSLIAAIKLASEMAAHRAAYKN